MHQIFKYVPAHVSTCIRRPKTKHASCLSGAIKLSSWNSLLLGPGAHKLGYSDCLTSPGSAWFPSAGITNISPYLAFQNWCLCLNIGPCAYAVNTLQTEPSPLLQDPRLMCHSTNQLSDFRNWQFLIWPSKFQDTEWAMLEGARLQIYKLSPAGPKWGQLRRGFSCWMVGKIKRIIFCNTWNLNFRVHNYSFSGTQPGCD